MIDGALQEYKEKPGSCAACGTSPVNHWEAYIGQSLSVMSTEFSRRRTGRIFRAIRAFSDASFEYVEPAFFRMMAAFPLARFSHDPSKAKTYRSQVIWEEAIRRGIPMEQLAMKERYTDIYRAFIRGGWHYFVSLPVPPEMMRGISDFVDDKTLLKQTLREADIATPRSFSVTSVDEALEAMKTIGAPVVAKPRSGSRGRHTTVDIRTEAELREGFHIASQICRYVAIETYLRGGVSRATVVGGTLVGFFEGLPPTILGDGVSTIAQLIGRKNASKPERVQDIVLNADHREFLARHHLSELSVPAEGMEVLLTHRTGRLFGGATRELLDTVHPKLRDYCERAAAAIRSPLVGFDLIIQDPEADPDGQQWGIIEGNSLPYIDLHYLPLYGKPSNVAAAVWDLWQ